MDVNENGKHLVQIFIGSGEKKQLVTDIEALWSYGYRRQTADGSRIYLVGDADRQILLSLKSLNPNVVNGCLLVFDIEPPVLSYLRKKDKVQETPASQRVHISETEAKVGVQVDYDPTQGLSVEIGYADPQDESRFIPGDRVKKTLDGAYVRIGDHFARSPKIAGKATLDPSNSSPRKIPPGRIPEFLTEELDAIKGEVKTFFTEQARRIKIAREPMKPTVRIDFDPRVGVKVEAGYKLGEDPEHLIPQERLETTESGRFVKFSDTYFPLKKPAAPELKALLMQFRKNVAINDIPEFFQTLVSANSG
jgi:hypothetical protein